MAARNKSVAMLKALLVRIPLILKTLVLHGLYLSPVSGKQDLRTELTVAIIRSFLDISMPVGKQQRVLTRDPGIKGPMWVSKVTLPAPEDDVKDAVIKAIDELKTSGAETFEVPPVRPVEAEWTGYRSGVDKKAPQPNLSEEEKYRELRKESKSDMVILYIHGGALLMDPATHRIPVARLSKLTGAPVLSVRYRLAPQNPFPAALVDVLVAYLSLISPPPGSLHDAVPAGKIVLAGDSAGGNLSLALLQTLLTLRRIAPSIRFHGKDIPIELPAGLALSSPWCDLTRSMPSVRDNAKFDYIIPPHEPPETLYAPPPHQPDDVWPRSPPRVDMYSDANMVAHPLVSPLAARKELWKGAPPLYIGMGEEGLTDEGLLLARKVHQAGSSVIVDQFEGMPHCFGLIMLGTQAGRRFYQNWADFCRDAVAGRVKEEEEKGKAGVGYLTVHRYGLRSTKQIPLDDVHPFDDEDVERRIHDSMRRRVEGETALVNEWRVKAKL
ncbi:Lipase/esterase [Rasamsonia emersonii CBS 393.64]|uniref:Lipase/esterase n=1 Tax=Rasamsonia emersonii (strain ATCC 16479 / CBS 393.64 / IMI 116815) TaxID=1408163 RepID=A0A0F4YUK1_RASE3|nr:Lipase/esterase [Rasamsonia emersonii CBS 393.64]KKA21298.1 Lipase/esterase [Rasamsonia emersonii CBS 393.64]